MNHKKTDVRLLTQMALLTAVIVVMSFTPLGYIPLPFMRATTLHIPVILGACLLGPKMGAVLGGVFGVTSVVKATLEPNITSFVFTPFYSFNEQFSGNGWSLVVAILPRVLIGVIAGYVFIALSKMIAGGMGKTVAFAVSGFIGSMVNTIGVMGLIYILFGEQYAIAGGNDPALLLGIIMGVVGMNGVPEAIIAAILTCAIGKALLAVFKDLRAASPAKVG